MSIPVIQRRTGAPIAAIIAVLALLVLALSGCSVVKGAASAASPETKTSYNIDQGAANITVTFYAKGDKVMRQTTHSTLNYAKMGYPDKESAKAALDPIVAEFQGVKGLTHSMQYKETEAIEDLEVDYSKADIAQVSKLTGSEFSGGSAQKGVSLKKTIEGLEAAGFTKVE